MNKIVSTFEGRLGNNLFQYFFGKIIAKKTNSEFFVSHQIDTLFNFQLNKLQPNLTSYDLIEEVYESTAINSLKLFFNKKQIDFNLNKIVDEINSSQNNLFVLKGFFQKFYYYFDDRDFIKKEFNFDFSQKEKILGIHLRKGDITNTINDLPDLWFEYMCENFTEHKKIITTDSPNHPLVHKLISNGCVLYQNTPENTLLEFATFSDLVLSQGSFSWWMGFLSDGTKHILIPSNGWNSINSSIKLLPKNNKDWKYYNIINNNVTKI